jgi:hypothetical protein
VSYEFEKKKKVEGSGLGLIRDAKGVLAWGTEE